MKHYISYLIGIALIVHIITVNGSIDDGDIDDLYDDYDSEYDDDNDEYYSSLDLDTKVTTIAASNNNNEKGESGNELTSVTPTKFTVTTSNPTSMNSSSDFEFDDNDKAVVTELPNDDLDEKILKTEPPDEEKEKIGSNVLGAGFWGGANVKKKNEHTPKLVQSEKVEGFSVPDDCSKYQVSIFLVYMTLLLLKTG